MASTLTIKKNLRILEKVRILKKFKKKTISLHSLILHNL